jgi:hypothetical protein
VWPGSSCFCWIELHDASSLDLLPLAALVLFLLQKSSQRQLVNSVFPKLAVYNSVDPSVAPSLLMVSWPFLDNFLLSMLYFRRLNLGYSQQIQLW